MPLAVLTDVNVDITECCTTKTVFWVDIIHLYSYVNCIHSRFEFAFEKLLQMFGCMFGMFVEKFRCKSPKRIAYCSIIVNTLKEVQNKHWNFAMNISNLQTNI